VRFTWDTASKTDVTIYSWPRNASSTPWSSTLPLPHTLSWAKPKHEVWEHTGRGTMDSGEGTCSIASTFTSQSSSHSVAGSSFSTLSPPSAPCAPLPSLRPAAADGASPARHLSTAITCVGRRRKHSLGVRCALPYGHGSVPVVVNQGAHMPYLRVPTTASAL
jgi:hypothetical protein